MSGTRVTPRVGAGFPCSGRGGAARRDGKLPCHAGVRQENKPFEGACDLAGPGPAAEDAAPAGGDEPGGRGDRRNRKAAGLPEPGRPVRASMGIQASRSSAISRASRPKKAGRRPAAPGPGPTASRPGDARFPPRQPAGAVLPAGVRPQGHAPTDRTHEAHRARINPRSPTPCLCRFRVAGHEATGADRSAHRRDERLLEGIGPGPGRTCPDRALGTGRACLCEPAGAGPPGRSSVAAQFMEEVLYDVQMPGAGHLVVDVFADGEVEDSEAEGREDHGPVLRERHPAGHDVV